MTKAELIRKYIADSCDADVAKFDMCICKHCIDALHSRGEKIISTDDHIIDGWDLDTFIQYGGLDDAEDGNEPIGCEWCEEIDDLYGVIFI